MHHDIYLARAYKTCSTLKTTLHASAEVFLVQYVFSEFYIVHLLLMLLNKTFGLWIFEFRQVSVTRCHSPPPQHSLLKHHRLFVNDGAIVTDCFLPSCECICFFSLISPSFSLIVTLTLYQRLFLSQTDSWFTHSHSIMLPVHDRFSGRSVPTHPLPKALLCNHTKYVGNPFYFHT